MNLNTQTEDKLENLPSRERWNIEGRRGYRNKDFNWAHFRGFLESRVGLPIDRVIHEFVICDWCPARHRVASKIGEVVEMNTFRRGRKIYYFTEYTNKERCIDDGAWGRHALLYLHPETRILCVAQRQSKSAYKAVTKAERNAKVRILGDYHQLYKLAGTWYELKAEIVPDDSLLINKERKGPRSILLELNGSSWYDINRRTKFPFVKIVLKRQLNSKELKHHGLKNDAKILGGKRCEKCGGFDCLLHSENWMESRLNTLSYRF